MINMRHRHTGGWILAGMFVTALVPVCYYVYALCNSAIVVRAPEVIMEMGEPVALNPEQYLSITTKDMKNIIIDSDLNTNTEKYNYDEDTKQVTTKGLDYLDAGVYDITFTRENCNTVIPQTLHIRVKDTIAPEFVEVQEDGIIIEQYAVVDFTKYFTIKDVDAESKVYINNDQVNTLEQGTYTMKVTAEDSTGNKNSEFVTVTVVSEAYAEKHPDKLTRTTAGAVPLSKATKARIERKELDKRDFEKQEA